MSNATSISNIEYVIPHRGAMLLLDRVIRCDEDSIEAQLEVPADGPFHTETGVPAYVGIEYMAQAVACWAGNMARQRGLPPPLGFLLGSRRYDSAVPVFACGDLLQVEARREIMGENGLGVFACRILSKGQVLASANISVFEPPDAKSFLEHDA